MKEVPLSEARDDLSRFLREAGKREIVITRHGKPAGVPIGFESEDDWFEYRLETGPRFLRRIESAHPLWFDRLTTSGVFEDSVRRECRSRLLLPAAAVGLLPAGRAYPAALGLSSPGSRVQPDTR